MAVDDYLAREMGRRSEDVVRRWLDKLSSRLGVRPRRVFPTEAMLDHMPVVVRKVAESLSAPRRQDTGREFVVHLRELARLRHGQGYDVQEVMRELEVLGSLLYQELAEVVESAPERPDPAELVEVTRRLHRGLNVVGTITAGTFREAEAERQREHAEMVASFTRTLAHELKNPLGAAQGAAELLSEEQMASDPEQRKRFAELIVRNLHRARDLVDDVRALSLAQARDGVEPRRAWLPEIVRVVVDEVGMAAEEKGVRLEVDEPVPELEVDAVRVELALINLVWNAVKYADPEKGDRWVRVEVAAEEGHWRIAVSDNGLGIPREQHQRVFERFFRAHADIAEGTGLGLSITREAIAQLGGDVGFESREGEGSTFHFTLPGRAVRERGETEPAALAEER